MTSGGTALVGSAARLVDVETVTAGLQSFDLACVATHGQRVSQQVFGKFPINFRYGQVEDSLVCDFFPTRESIQNIQGLQLSTAMRYEVIASFTYRRYLVAHLLTSERT